ncbi:extracellular solute-binding protein [Isoptericola variabilis]|uniref:Extracellular solute-binding protein family 1 n=1 Tax=Isoptericola variabilis (strain 225) TaxID=743718 RepID=F6FTM0_ISOV2|nr:extracellular solute-binding protein [Isoptericola variabilis]AEG43213.1 extracellular solute-binding protein family 1 [Isoptericola variabilis 225]TWH35148.1 arabinogalactan oligomer/maltooligosaccharide transport system substrate-binding protein [Isoptericola variabilis J7]
MRRAAIPVAALATLALVTACGGGEGQSPEATPDDTTQATEPAASGSITVWVDENREPAVAAAAETFTAETGVEVELVQKNFEDIRADFLAQVPTGEGPDITVGAHDWLGSFIVNGVVDSVDLGDKAGEFEDVAIEALTYDGQLYGLPYALETVALIRNTALAPDPVPATFDEMIEVGRAAGTPLPFVINTNGTTGDAYTYYAFQTSFGAPVFVQQPDGSYTNELGMGGEEGYAFAEWLGANGMAGEGLFSTDWTYDIANQEFADGNAPFTVAGPWAISTYTDAGVDVAVEPIPSAGGETAAPFVGVQAFYLSAQSDNALVATDFLTNYVATPEAMRALHEADPRIPAMSEVAQEVAEDPIIAGFLAASQNGTPMPSIPEMGDVWQHWNAAQASIISGSAEPRAAWDKMLADLESALGG